MTEQEALEKRCCGPEGCGVVGDPAYEGGPCSRWCVGPLCMGWRGGLWERVDRPAAMGVPDGPGWIKDGQESGIGGAVTNRQQWKREQFFCGLAGKP